MDASGRRRKLARRASLAAVAVLAGYAALLAVSFAGGPIPPKALLPVPGIPSGKAESPAVPANAAPSSAGGHAVVADRPTGGETRPRSEARTSSQNGSPGQSAPSEPRSTSPGPGPTSASALPPTPTGTSAAATTSVTTRGNPTAPGRTRHKSPAPSQSS